MLHRLFAASGLVALITLLPVSPALAAGLPGYCPDAQGVTVVVDFTQLGGDLVVRCSPEPNNSGIAALEGAGFTVAGTTRFGKGLLCRINGQPSAAEQSCVNAPPASAYWAYWHAPNGGDWRYSSIGPAGRNPPPGSFEGWAFSRSGSESSAREPGLAPVRPANPAPTSAPDPEPSSAPVTTQPAPRPPSPATPPRQDPTPDTATRRASAGPDQSTGSTSATAGTPATQASAQTSSSAEPSRSPASTAQPPSVAASALASGSATPTPAGAVSFEVPENDSSGGSSPIGALVSAGVVVVVAAVAGAVAFTRRRSRP